MATVLGNGLACYLTFVFRLRSCTVCKLPSRWKIRVTPLDVLCTIHRLSQLELNVFPLVGLDPAALDVL